MNELGHSNDLWVASLTMYTYFLFSFTSIVLVVTFKLATHTKFWSAMLVIVIVFFSLALYIAYMWVSNYIFSDYLKGAVYMFFTHA